MNRPTSNIAPNTPEALQQAAIEAAQANDLPRAIDLITRAIALRPTAEYHLNLCGFYLGLKRTEEAIASARDALTLDPRNPSAYFALGLAQSEKGEIDAAIDAYYRAIGLRPSFVEAQSNLAIELVGRGRVDEAIAAFENAIRLNPSAVELHHNLALALAKKRNYPAALAALSRATQLRPDYAEAYFNRGVIEHAMEEFEKAVASNRRVLEIRPDDVNSRINLASALNNLSKYDEAIETLQQLPDVPALSVNALFQLGTALNGRREWDEAMECFRACLALKPDYAEAYCGIGDSLRGKEQLRESTEVYQKAIALKPDSADALNRLGVAYAESHQFDEALHHLYKAIELKNDLPLAHLNIAVIDLLRGDLARGLPRYEWRLKVKPITATQFPHPRWKGERLDGKTILLTPEQGFGDTIQFARYVPMVAARGGKVILSSQKELVRLMRSVEGVHAVVPRGEVLPKFNLQCPLMTLPTLFGTTVESIPAQVPYLKEPASLRETWAARFPPDGRLRIGLVWAGQPAHPRDRKRSIELAMLAPLAEIEGVQFYSMQKGKSAEQVKDAPPGLRLIDWTNEFGDFADSAAMMANLDLLISVDTSSAHLAGAIAKPVWVMIPSLPDWRWILGRNDTPWYPTMRLFRQEQGETWEPVIARIVNALRLWAEEKRKH